MRRRSGGQGYDPRVPPKPSLTILPDPELTPADKVRTRVKRQRRPDGLLQCPKCGGRTEMTARAGVFVQDGKITNRGTVVERHVCADCWPLRVRMVPGGQGPKLVR